MAHLNDVLVEQLRVDYVTSKATKRIEEQHSKQAAKVAKQVRNAPKLLLQVDSLRLNGGQIGFVNQSSQPPYRLFLADVDLKLENLSNQANQGRSKFQVRGSFMGSGPARLAGEFQPNGKSADFALRLQLDHAALPSLNGFLLANTGVDVAAGLFSVYTEITVKNGRVDGYLKPLVKDLQIYDKAKDQHKSFGKRVEMHVLQFLANRLRNSSTRQVATVVRLSGPTSDPKASEWEVIRKLVGNGFFRAILPGFMTGTQAAPSPSRSKPPAQRH